MKKLLFAFSAVALLSVTSCGKSDAQETSKEITTEVIAESNNGETSVTITSTEDGKTTTKVLTGKEAEDYLASEDHTSMEYPEDAEVIIKEFKKDMDISLDIEDILNDPELKDLDEATKEKIRAAFKNATDDMEFEWTEEDGEKGVKTKVVIMKED